MTDVLPTEIWLRGKTTQLIFRFPGCEPRVGGNPVETDLINPLLDLAWVAESMDTHEYMCVCMSMFGSTHE